MTLRRRRGCAEQWALAHLQDLKWLKAVCGATEALQHAEVHRHTLELRLQVAPGSATNREAMLAKGGCGELFVGSEEALRTATAVTCVSFCTRFPFFKLHDSTSEALAFGVKTRTLFMTLNTRLEIFEICKSSTQVLLEQHGQF